MQPKSSRKPQTASYRIGTSGWSYRHWKDGFYPRDLPSDRQLDYYSKQFRAVEINNSFYNLPEASTLRAWRKTVPPDFVFSIKASRYITHMKKLKNPQASVKRFFERIAVLGDRLGPVLFQLPPRWSFDAQRLEDFLKALSRDFRYAFEFRDRSWFNEEAYAELERHEAALCIYDLEGYTSPKELTADFVYVRLHGPEGRYQGSYDTRSLSGWAGAFHAWSRKAREIHCYFDNDEAAHAPQDALRLRRMLEKRK